MPTNVLTEKDYQKYIINKLINDNGYILRKDNDFDRLFAIDSIVGSLFGAITTA